MKMRFNSPYDDIEGRSTSDYRDQVVEVLGFVDPPAGACEEEVTIASDQRRVRFPDGWEAIAWNVELHEVTS